MRTLIRSGSGEHGGPLVICGNVIVNSGFETFCDGRPCGWEASSPLGYPLADGTWFYEGHYGAYFGGYNYAADRLWQPFDVPTDIVGSAKLTYRWYIRSTEGTTNDWDHLKVWVRDSNGNTITPNPLDTRDNTNPREMWQITYEIPVDLSGYAGQGLYLSFEADTDYSLPTSFFVDNVTLDILHTGEIAGEDLGGSELPAHGPRHQQYSRGTCLASPLSPTESRLRRAFGRAPAQFDNRAFCWHNRDYDEYK